jgi:hypothetical protein
MFEIRGFSELQPCINRCNIGGIVALDLKTSVLRRLSPFPSEAPPIGKIHSFSKMAITVEPLNGF